MGEHFFIDRVDRKLINQPIGCMAFAPEHVGCLDGHIMIEQEDHSGASAICSATSQSISSRWSS